MNVKELYKYLDSAIPSSLSCEWDNDGLMCAPDSTREVKRVLIALDITGEVTKKAIDASYDLVISHHPLIFKGVKSLTEDSFISAKLIDLIKSGVSAMSFHTRLDAVAGGVNDLLAEKLGVKNAAPFGIDATPIGRIGTLASPMELSDFAALVKSTLGAPYVAFADAGKKVEKVALLGGAGEDDITAAIFAGADTYVSGELGYHHLTDAPDGEINLIEAGHFYTEYPVCERIAELVRSADNKIECDIFCSDRTKVI